MKLIIDIGEEEYKEVLKDTYSGTSFENKIFTAIANGTPIPDNATNGDVMKIIFPKMGLYDEWYDEPYQKGGKE